MKVFEWSPDRCLWVKDLHGCKWSIGDKLELRISGISFIAEFTEVTGPVVSEKECRSCTSRQIRELGSGEFIRASSAICLFCPCDRRPEDDRKPMYLKVLKTR